MKYQIKIARNAEMVVQSDGKTVTNARPRYVEATRDPNSGCMLFRLPVWGKCYVAEGFEIVSEVR